MGLFVSVERDPALSSVGSDDRLFAILVPIVSTNRVSVGREVVPWLLCGGGVVEIFDEDDDEGAKRAVDCWGEE